MIIAMTGKKRNIRQRLYSERKCDGREEEIAYIIIMKYTIINI